MEWLENTHAQALICSRLSPCLTLGAAAKEMTFGVGQTEMEMNSPSLVAPMELLLCELPANDILFLSSDSCLITYYLDAIC